MQSRGRGTTILLASGLVLLGATLPFGSFIYNLFPGSNSLRRLIERYGTTVKPEGPTHTGQSVQVGIVRWRLCTTICIDPRGLYLHVKAPGSSFSPVLIPWNEIHVVRETRLYWHKAMILSIGEPQVTTLKLMTPIFDLMQPYPTHEPPDASAS